MNSGMISKHELHPQTAIRSRNGYSVCGSVLAGNRMLATVCRAEQRQDPVCGGSRESPRKAKIREHSSLKGRKEAEEETWMVSNLGRGPADVASLNSGRKGMVPHLGRESEGVTHTQLPRACGQCEEGGELEQLGCPPVEGRGYF